MQDLKLNPKFELYLFTVQCLSGLVIQLVFSDGRPPEDMFFGSHLTPSKIYNITDKQIAVVGFHGLIGDNCIRRLGVYTQMDSNELKGEPFIPYYDS